MGQTMKTSIEPRNYTDGPTLDDAEAVEALLRADDDGRWLRIPVVIESSALGVEKASIGVGADAKVVLSEPLSVSDSALGIALSERVRMLCPDQPVCVVWLEGSRGDLVPGLESDGIGFSVRVVGERVAADAALSTTHVGIESTPDD